MLASVIPRLYTEPKNELGWRWASARIAGLWAVMKAKEGATFKMEVS